MNSRADDGTIVQAHSTNTIINDKEVKDKIAKISGSVFELLKKQLDDKRNAFLAEITAAEDLASRSHFYSTKSLKSKLTENYRTALHNQALENPLEYFKQKCLKDYEEKLKKIEEDYTAIKIKVKTNLEINASVTESMHQLEPPLYRRVDKLKKDLIETLQNVAAEYREYLISIGEWVKRIPEFTDKFSCVGTTYGALQPKIDKSTGYGLKFGHVIRDKGELPRKPFSIDEIKKMELKDIEKMINQVIQECLYKPYANDAHIVHEKIKTHFDRLEKERPKDNYDDVKDFEFQKYGTFYQYLSSFKIIKKEHELLEIPMNFHRKTLIDEEKRQDQEVAGDIHAVLKNLQSLVDQFKSTTDGDIALVAGECKRTIASFDEAAAALYNDIESSHIKMAFVNSDAKSMRLAIDSFTHKVQLAYEDSIKAAKQLNEVSFKSNYEAALDHLQIANNKKHELNNHIKELEKYELTMAEKLRLAATQFEGSIHKTLQTKYAREVIKFTKLRTDITSSNQYIEEANQLPKAIQVYGDFTFDYVRSRSAIKDASQYFEKIPESIENIWKSYNKMLDDAQAKITFKFHEYQKSALQQVAFTSELLKNGNEFLEKAKHFQSSAEHKLNVAKTQFPIKLHAEHQENFDIVQMELIDAYKQREDEIKNFEIVKYMPDAIKDYSDILYKVSVMQDETRSVELSCRAIAKEKEELEQIEIIAKKSQEFGVVQKSFAETAKLKLEKAKSTLKKAACLLKEVEGIKYSEQKMLELTKRTYPHEMHKKPQAIFDSACTRYSSALTSYESAEKDLKASEDLCNTICEEVNNAAIVEKEKQLATNFRQLLLKTILFHLEVWPGKWGGGIDFRFMGKVHRIPHGVFELIDALNSSADHKLWMENVLKVAKARNAIKYFFQIRNDSTSALYCAIKNHLKLNEKSLELLTNECQKIIPGLESEEKGIPLTNHF